MKKKLIVVLLLISIAAAAAILSFTISCQTPSTVSASMEPRIRLSSDYFNHVQEKLTIFLPEVEMLQALSWRVEVLEPHPSYLVFHEWVGRGQPPEQVIWDGKNFVGDWVHSASDYPLVYYVCDVYGNIKTVETRIPVDDFVFSD